MNARITTAVTAAAVALLTACATSPTGRHQLEFFAPAQMAQMGNTAYQEIKKETPETQDAGQRRYVQCVTDALTRVVPPPVDGGQWNVTVFKDDDSVNAFALPGGNIGVYTGLLKVAKNQHQLAAVVGHELGHVQAQHANARMSTQYATSAGIQLAAAVAGASGRGDQQAIMGLLGLGAQVGVILPFSRAQETESDVLGLRYMAEAGFDPRQSVDLWRNMQAAGGGKPPEFLSTHPSSDSRITALQKQMPEAMRLYEQARARGLNPNCS